MNTLDDFVTLFRGRGDAYGSWDGGCIRKPVTRELFQEHLNGTTLFGVYPLVPFEGGVGCVWGCTDIDVDDLDAARNLQTAFSIKNINAHVERTRKGYHIWVFADSLVPASTMRRAFLAAHQAINYPAKEVNPKQETIGSGYGNYVRLPYPNGLNEMPINRFMLNELDEPIALTQWLSIAIKTRTNRATLDEIAKLYTPPTILTVSLDEPTEDVKVLLKKVSVIPYIIWRDGPYQGADRSTTLYKLCHRLAESGLTPTEAFTVLKDADKRWGKFHLRSDGDSEMMKMIDHAFGAQR